MEKHINIVQRWEEVEVAPEDGLAEGVRDTSEDLSVCLWYEKTSFW